MTEELKQLQISKNMNIIKSKAAKQILARTYDGVHVCYENAEAAVEIAEQEMKEKCCIAFRDFMLTTLANVSGEQLDFKKEFINTINKI